MGKKTTPIEKAARMLDLVPFISTHQGISTKDLAAEFGISIEELLSDLNSLWMCGDNRFDLIDLEFESGYVSIRNADTLNRIRSLSQQEIIAVLIGLDLIESDLPSNRRDLVSEIESLRNRLGGQLTRIIDASPALDGQILACVRQAVEQNRQLEIRYFSSSDDEITSRIISPLQLNSENGKDFLVAFCEQAAAQRTFRVDRISEAKLIDVQSRQVNIVDEFSVKTIARLRINSNLRQSRESLGPSVIGEGDEVTISTYGSNWISRTVMSAADAMTVLSPPEFRNEVAKAAQKALDLYR